MLTLEGFRRRAGFNPWHFWQLSDSEIAPLGQCSTLVSEYTWQSNAHASRSELRNAIIRAGVKLKEALGYPVVREQMSERIAFRQPASIRQQYARSQDARGRYLNFRTSSGWVRRAGVMKISEVSTVSVSLSDTNNDGANDMALISAPFSYPASEAALYLPSSEWRDGVIGEAWRVEPLWLRVNGVTLTAQVPLWMLVKRALYESRGGGISIQPQSFVGEVVVARRWVDTSAQGYFVWEAQGEACNEGDDPSLLTRQTARFVVRDEREGYLAGETAEWDAVNLHYHARGWALEQQPDYIEADYVAGRDDDDTINEAHYMLACAELAGGLCACGAANDEVIKWQVDLAQSTEQGSFSTPFETMTNPFGTRRGHVEAWQMVKNLRRADASVIVR